MPGLHPETRNFAPERRGALIPMTVVHFLLWYFIEKPIQIIRGYWLYTRTFGEIFSFKFMLMTFLSPWKNITARYPRSILEIGLIAEVLVQNITSRTVGMIFRLVTLAMGIITELIILALSLAILIFWMGFPVVFFYGITIILTTVL